ncbi:MAG TPA: VCBS repeat-containing protein, partial [Vicinamibacterales bacterium]
AVFVFEGRTVWPRRLDAVRDAMFTMSGATPTIWNAHPRLVDVNGDGADDLVAAMAALDERGAGRVAIVFGGRRRGGLTENDADVVIRGAAQFGYALATADVDADGRPDLIAGDRTAGTVHVIRGRPEWPRRGFTTEFSAAVFTRAGGATGGHGLAVGDADGDGAVDVALGLGTPGLGVMRPALPLSVDVRPNAAPNVLVSGGVVSIAVRLPDGIDDELDIGSLRVAGVAPSQVAAINGRKDVQIYFDVNRLRLRPGATRLSVIGRTRSGIPVSGSDAIVMPAAIAAGPR